MTAILNAVNYRTTVTVVAASSGDGDTIAAKFNGVVIPGVSNTAAVAANSSGTVTIYWQPQSGVRGGNGLVLTAVSAMIAADTSLTSPISVSVATTTAMTS